MTYLNEKMAFAVETAFAKTEDHTSKLHLKNKQELYHALTDRETFSSILEQSYDDSNNKEEEQVVYLKYNKDKIVNYFMELKDKVKLQELDLNFYPCSNCNNPFIFSSIENTYLSSCQSVVLLLIRQSDITHSEFKKLQDRCMLQK